jgi:hypothetical protein
MRLGEEPPGDRQDHQLGGPAKYLQTRADGNSSDDLLALPPCPW